MRGQHFMLWELHSSSNHQFNFQCQFLLARAVHNKHTSSGVAWHLAGGEVAASIADVALLEVQLPKLLKLHRQDIQRALLLILDGNMPQLSILVSPLSLHVFSAFRLRIRICINPGLQFACSCQTPLKIHATRMVSLALSQ